MRPGCLDTRVDWGSLLILPVVWNVCILMYRDLKPENLLLSADQKTSKLADFRLAREETLTEMMTAETGTYHWMAPELYSTVTLRQGEKKHYNNKGDAYSFAIVLRELLHNKLPVEGMSNLQAAYAAAFNVTHYLTTFFSVVLLLRRFYASVMMDVLAMVKVSIWPMLQMSRNISATMG
ncbi:unnamed protein product [Rhodiola kirilowii]